MPAIFFEFLISGPRFSEFVAFFGAGESGNVEGQWRVAPFGECPRQRLATSQNCFSNTPLSRAPPTGQNFSRSLGSEDFCR